MSVVLSDEDIERLVAQEKPLPETFRGLLETRQRRGHRESRLTVTGVSGDEFVVMVRQSISNTMDFSVILGYQLPSSNRIFRLRRYNGKSHWHTNLLERDSFYDFHIHEATERYQQLGAKEDGYAAVSDRYATLDEAVGCMFENCGFQLPDDAQGRLFEGF